MDGELPWSKPRKPMGLIVILAGLATSAITLGIVYAADRADVSIMGLYVMPFIPFGAILAGLAAGSGYAVATWVKGVKISAAICAAIIVLQLGCYATAQYLDYRAVGPVYEDGTPVGFVRYFDYVTRSFRWKEEYRDKPGEALGVWGYGIRLLEVAGFGFGGLIGALVIRKMAYCERCQQYMKRRKLASIAASLPPRKIPKKDAEALAAHQAGQQAAEQNARQSLQRLADLATRGDHAGFQGVLCDLAPAAKGAEKLPVSIKLEMVSCRQCGNGFLRASTVKRVGNRSVATQLNKWDMSPEFISSMQDFRPRRAATSTQGLR